MPTFRFPRSWLLLCLLTATVLGWSTFPSSAFAACGDTVVDAGEDCDVGPDVGGDCCSATCLYESAGSACADEGEFCTRDICNAAGACVHDGTPLDTCLVAPKGKLQIVNSADDTKDSLSLQMQNAPGISPSDFGDPSRTDTYHACIFGPDGLLMQAEVAPGGTCSGKACWAETTTGFTYKDPSGAKDGITSLLLKANAKPKTKITAKGRGTALEDPTLPFPNAVMAQIVNRETSQCFETYFLEQSAVKQNDSERYAAKSAAPGFEIPGLAEVIRQEDLPIGTPSIADEPGIIPNIGPDPTQVYVQSISYGGSGCPQGSVATALSNDRSSFTLIFDQFVASKGPGLPPTEASKSCQVNLNLKIPQGWQYTIATMDHRGFLALPKKMKARQEATYYFQGDGALASADTSFAGPALKAYLLRDTLPFSTVVWSSCTKVRPLNVTTLLELKAGTELGQMTAASLDGKIDFVFGLRWKQCGAESTPE